MLLRVPILRSEFFEGDSLFVSIGVLWYPPSGRQESSWLYWTQLSGNPYWKKGRSGKESNLTQPMNTISVFFLTCWWSNWEDQSPTHLETGKIPEGFSHSSLIFNYYYLIYSTHCQVFSTTPSGFSSFPQRLRVSQKGLSRPIQRFCLFWHNYDST